MLREPVRFLVEAFFSLRSKESIPRPESLFRQKVIAKVVAKVEHFDDQERKEKGTKEEEKDNSNNQNWIQNQIWFYPSIAFNIFLKVNKRKKLGKKEKGNKGNRSSNKLKAHRGDSELDFKLFFALAHLVGP